MLKQLFLICIFTSGYTIEKQDSSQGIPYTWHIPESYDEISSWSKIAAYKLASYLTDPLCKIREYTIRAQILEDLPPSPCIQYSLDPICTYIKQMQLVDERWLDIQTVSRFTERCFLLSSAAIFSAMTPFTALPAIALRFAASYLESDQFIHYKGLFQEKELKEKPLTHMLWNICGIKAGYDIEEGGQLPIRDDLLSFSEQRLFRIAQKILEEDPDVLCLNEVFDVNDAIYLVDALQNQYAHFVIQCGTRSIGLNSGLFLATKFGVESISFKPFPKEMINGATKYAEKGFLSVKTHDSKGSICNFITTHLQHSDQPEFPTFEEVEARKKQLNFILQNIDSDENAILAGDLNLDDDELVKANSDLYSQFKKTSDYKDFLNEEKNTWLGDQWYVEYGNRDFSFSLLSARKDKTRTVSQGVNLDHVLAKTRQDTTLNPEIQTILKSSGYRPEIISRDSLSDHMILLSEILLKR